MAIDLNGIKEEFQTILTKANEPTALPRDLSLNMINKVKQVLKVNPEKLPIDATYLPAVTIFIEGKELELQGMARNQQTAKRTAKIDFKIMGMVWNSNILDMGMFDEDPADEDIERLMENIEEILRSNDTLNGKLLWGHPTEVSYHSFTDGEQGHYRTSLMSFEGMVHY